MNRDTLKERQRQLREDLILDTAHELLLEQGYAEMSMDDLASRVGVSKATLYQHFPSKEELAVRVIVRSMGQGERYIASQDPQLPALQRLEQIMRHAIERRADLRTAKIRISPLCIKQHPLYIAQYNRMVLALTSLVEEAKTAGDIRADLPTQIVVRTLLSLVRDADYEDLVLSGETTLGELSGLLAQIFFKGIQPRTLSA